MAREREQGASPAEGRDGPGLTPRFDVLARDAAEGIVVHRDLVPLFVNAAFARLSGYEDPEAILSLGRLDTLFGPGVAPRLLGGAVPSVRELEGVRRDGAPLTLLGLANAVTWQGEPAILAHVVDVTERRRREREAEESQRLLRTVVDNSPVILWSIDAEGVVTVSAGKGLRAQDLEPGQVVGQSIFDIYAGNDEFLGHVRRALAGESFTAVNETRGAIYERFFQPLFDADGRVTGVTGVSVDVTRSARAERRARETERLLRSVIDALPHFVFLKDADLRYQVVNESFARFHGMSTGELIGLTGDDLPRRTPQSEALFAADDRRVLEEGATVRRTGYTGSTPQGGTADFEATKLPLRDDDGAVVGIVGIVDNVTEALRTRRELERYREHLEDLVAARTQELLSAQQDLMRSERLAAIGQLTATVSHELRNPLGTIRTSFQSLRRRLDVSHDPRTGRAVERIERSIDRCVSIIEELLDYTRTRPLKLDRVSLDEWIVDALADLEVPAGVALELRPASGATVSIDVERVRQALVNLVQNAGQSLVQLGAGPARRVVTVSTDLGEGRAAVHVHDTGSGVEPDLRERIFEPLFSTRAFGVGLGLPLVRAIAEQHGGDVVYGAPDAPAGSCFTVHLPLSDDEP